MPLAATAEIETFLQGIYENAVTYLLIDLRIQAGQEEVDRTLSMTIGTFYQNFIDRKKVP